MDGLIIVGYGGFGREVAWWAQDCGYSIQGFLNDAVAPGLYGRHCVLGTVREWTKFPSARFIVSIANPRIRKRVVASMCALGEPRFATIVHPSVIMSDAVSLGKGSVICPGVIVTVDIVMGTHAIVNKRCTIAHDGHLGDFVTLAPHVALSGNVKLEDGVEIGSTSALRQGVTMGAGSMLGMGGILTKSTEANTLYVGVPAKPSRLLPSF